MGVPYWFRIHKLFSSFFNMELTETIETINSQLVGQFGIDTITGQPIWRVVWSEDQYEKREVNTTPEGLILLTPIVKEVPKYKGWIHEKYVLEQLVLTPESTSKVGYEPIWTFMDNNGNYLPPTFPAAKFVIDLIYAARGKASMAKYKDTDTEEQREERVRGLYDELFGNETPVTDALAHGYGVVVPKTYDTTRES